MGVDHGTVGEPGCWFVDPMSLTFLRSLLSFFLSFFVLEIRKRKRKGSGEMTQTRLTFDGILI